MFAFHIPFVDTILPIANSILSNGMINISPTLHTKIPTYHHSGSYRQRNVFIYPPQMQEKCSVGDNVTGNGQCGMNGNSKRFQADQSTMGKSCDGTIKGPFEGLNTKTTLVGDDNAILYQVYFQGSIFQSQLTTFSNKGRRTG